MTALASLSPMELHAEPQVLNVTYLSTVLETHQIVPLMFMQSMALLVMTVQDSVILDNVLHIMPSVSLHLVNVVVVVAVVVAVVLFTRD